MAKRHGHAEQEQGHGAVDGIADVGEGPARHQLVILTRAGDDAPVASHLAGRRAEQRDSPAHQQRHECSLSQARETGRRQSDVDRSKPSAREAEHLQGKPKDRRRRSLRIAVTPASA